MENFRVRYGRVTEKRQPKNTLATSRDGETIYFGISRCRLEADRFLKVEGKSRATVRLNVALSKPGGKWEVDGDFRLHSSGLFGQVSVAEVKKLLQYFDNVDAISKPEY